MAVDYQALVMAAKTGDRDAMEALIIGNEGLCRKWVLKITSEYDPSYDDLMQIARMILMHAVTKYDPVKGKWSTYATGWLKQATQRYAHQDRMIQLPEYLAAKIHVIQQAIVTLQEQQRAVTDDAIAVMTGYPLHWIRQMRQHAKGIISLDIPAESDKHENIVTLGDMLEAPAEPVQDVDQRDDIRTALMLLTPRERDIISQRFGFGDGCGATLEAIGERHGITRERIRQIEGVALLKLKGIITRQRMRDAKAERMTQHGREEEIGA